MKGFIGTYNDNGIYSFELDIKTGIISNVNLISKISNSKYLKLTDEYIYSITTKNDLSGAAVIEKNGDVISLLHLENIPSCYIEVIEDKSIYISNYHNGTIFKIIFENNMLLPNKKYTVKEKAGCHQIIHYNNMLYIPCLNLDEILIMDLDLNLIDKIVLPNKVGPRHGVISDDFLYIVTENSNQLFKIDIKTNAVIEVLNLTSNEGSKGSAIRLSVDKKYLLIAIRGENNVYKVSLDNGTMKIDSVIPTFGDETRDIITVDDKYLLVANQYSSEVISISIEDKKEISRVSVPECASIVIGGKNGK